MCLAVPAKVIALSPGDPLTRTGRVDFGGVIKEINLAFTPEAEVGDYVPGACRLCDQCAQRGRGEKSPGRTRRSR